MRSRIHRYEGNGALMQCAIGWVLLLLLAFSASAQPAAQARAAAPAPRTVLVMGDSLSAAYGLSAAQGWVALTGAQLARSHPDWRIVNASISGETTMRRRGAHRRRAPAPPSRRGGDRTGRQRWPARPAAEADPRQPRPHDRRRPGGGARVLLVGMRIPPNYGPDYTRGFEDNFRTLAAERKVALLPFLLEPIALDRASFQGDNLHPTAAAQPRLRDHVWKALAPLLK